jgi:hypothetical protein
MKKWILYIFLLALPHSIWAQSKNMKGTIYDGLSFFPINEANVYNFSTKNYVFTDKKGQFQMNFKLNDTIIISKSIYRQELIVINQDHIDRGYLEVHLYYKAIVLKEVTVYAITPDYGQFIDEVVNSKLSDAYYHIKGAQLSEEQLNFVKYQNNPPSMLQQTPMSSPVTYFYQKYNKKYKNIQLAKELNDLREEVDMVPVKYNREMVAELTGLSGEELVDFMMYCRFSYYDIIRMSSEQIRQSILKYWTDYQYYKIINKE